MFCVEQPLFIALCAVQLGEQQFHFWFLPLVGLCTSDAGLWQATQEEHRSQMSVSNSLTGMKLCSFPMTLPHNLKVKFTLSVYTHHK